MQWACELGYIITIQMNSQIQNKCNEYINTSQIFFLIVGIRKIYNPQPLMGSLILQERKVCGRTGVGRFWKRATPLHAPTIGKYFLMYAFV